MKNKILKALSVVLVVCMLITVSGNAFSVFAEAVVDLTNRALYSLSNSSTYSSSIPGYNPSYPYYKTDGNVYYPTYTGGNYYPSYSPPRTWDDVYYTIVSPSEHESVSFGSPHNYYNYMHYVWEYRHPIETEDLLITFSESTYTESGWDYIYIYDEYGTNVGKFCGSSLAGKTIYVKGNVFRIKFTTDGSGTYYGFQITNVSAPCDHEYDDDKDVICNLCNAIKIHDHEYDDKFDFLCNLCNKPRPHTCEYDNVLDDVCNLCEYKRDITGTTVTYEGVHYTVNSSGTLDVTGCNYERRGDDYYYRRYVDELVIQPSVYGRAVTGISKDAFGNLWEYGSYNDYDYSYVIDKVVIPEGVKTIATYAFKNATIKDLYIPSSIVNMYDAAFKYADIINVYTPSLTAWCGMIFGYESSNPLHSATNFFVNNVLVNDLVIPNDVEVINDYAFCNFERFTSVTIPSNVKVINESAFVSCYGITSVNLSEGLEEIKTGAFANCSGITEITIPASVKTIGECAFCSCTGLEDITILYDESSNNSLYIDCEAFAGATNITDIWCTATKSQANITIADNSEVLLNADWHYGTCDAADHVYTNDCDAKCNNCDWVRDDAHIYTDILDSSCNVCGDVREVSNTFYEGNFQYYAEKVWDYNDENYHIELTLEGTRNLPVGEVIIPSNVKGYNVTAIGDNAFSHRDYITSIVIPDTVTYIGDRAFYYCYNLKNVTIGKGVNCIYDGAFAYCRNLENVYISNLKAWCEMSVYGTYDDEYYVSNPLYYASKLYLNGELITDLVIPEGTESIRYEAFKNLKHIESVTLPASLQTIYGSAFIGCTGIKTVNMKDGISSIGYRAFYNCTSLTDVYYDGLETDIDDINIGSQNGHLNSAEWHFISCDGAEHIYDNSCDNICNVCGSARSVKHSWGKGVVNKAATCLTEGSKTFTCTVCGTIKTETLLKTKTHNFGDWYADKEPTCIDFGKETRICADCDKRETRSIPSLGHEYSNACDKTCNNCDETRSTSHSWKSATCSAPKTCRICNETEGEPLPHQYSNKCDENCDVCGAVRVAESHEFSDVCDIDCNVCGIHREAPHKWENACDSVCDCGTIREVSDHNWLNATCINPKTCKECGATEGVAKGHASDNGTVVKNPTCTAAGKKTYKCTECNVIIKNETIVAFGHTYTDATCESPKTCKTCGVTMGQALGHSYSNTCDGDCNTCGKTRKVEHTYYAAFMSNATGHWYQCAVCGNKDSVENHTYDNACDTMCNICGKYRTVTGHYWSSATCTSPKTCRECGVTEGKANGHNYSNNCDKICNTCGATRNVPAHIYDSGKVTTKATCTKTGVKTYTCTECSATKTESIAKVAHTSDAGTVTTKATCTKTGVKTYKCTVCKTTVKTETIKATGHNYKTTTTAATLTKNGKTVVKCTVCGSVKSTTTIKYAKTIKLSKTTFTYNGKAQKPTVTVKDSAGKTISSKYYTVTFASGCKNVGKYKVTIKFKGNYSGTKTLYFTINPTKTTLSKVTPATKKLTVTYTKKTAEVTGYEVQYSTSKSFTTKTTKTKIVSKNTTTKATITGLKAKTTYYVRVRTYKTVSGKKYYSGWSTVKSAKTK